MVSAPLTFSGDPASAKVRLVLDKWGCPEGNTLKPPLALFIPWKAALVLMFPGTELKEVRTGESDKWGGGFLNNL